MRESGIQSKILSYLNSLPKSVAENVSGNASQSGRSDINACYRGRSLRIEVKGGTKGYGATQQQKFDLKKWESAGAKVAVVESVQEVRVILKEIDDEIHARDDRKRKG